MLTFFLMFYAYQLSRKVTVSASFYDDPLMVVRDFSNAEE